MGTQGPASEESVGVCVAGFCINYNSYAGMNCSQAMGGASFLAADATGLFSQIFASCEVYGAALSAHGGPTLDCKRLFPPPPPLVPSLRSSSSCMAAVVKACDDARRASVGNCLVCTAVWHASHLSAAGCSATEISDFCVGQPPPPPAAKMANCGWYTGTTDPGYVCSFCESTLGAPCKPCAPCVATPAAPTCAPCAPCLAIASVCSVHKCW